MIMSTQRDGIRRPTGLWLVDVAYVLAVVSLMGWWFVG